MTNTPTDTAPEAITQADERLAFDIGRLIDTGDASEDAIRLEVARHRRLTSHSAGEGLREALIRVARMIPGVLCADGVSDAFLAHIPDELAHYTITRTPPSDAGSTTRSGGEGVLHVHRCSCGAAFSTGGELTWHQEHRCALATTPSPDSGEAGHRNIHGEPIPDVPLTPYADPDPSPAIVKEAGEVERLRGTLSSARRVISGMLLELQDVWGDDEGDEPKALNALADIDAALSASNAAQEVSRG